MTDYLRAVSPLEQTGFEHPFETLAGKQAQVDFAQFKVNFRRDPRRMTVLYGSGLLALPVRAFRLAPGPHMSEDA